MYRRGDGPLKKRFSKISIHSLGFRIFVLLAVMIVLFARLSRTTTQPLSV